MGRLCKKMPSLTGVKYNEQNKHQLLHRIARVWISLIYIRRLTYTHTQKHTNIHTHIITHKLQLILLKYTLFPYANNIFTHQDKFA